MSDHLFEQCGVTVSFIDDYFQDYQHMVNCSSYTLNKLRQSTTQSSKIKSLFDCLDELYSDTEPTKYAAIFSKTTALSLLVDLDFLICYNPNLKQN